MNRYTALAFTIGAIVSTSVGAKVVHKARPLGNIETVVSSKNDGDVQPGHYYSDVAYCPGTKRATGGGYSIDSTSTDQVLVTTIGPSQLGNSWAIRIKNISTMSASISATVAVVCAND